MASLKTLILTVSLGLLAASSVLTAVAPVNAQPLRCFKCFYSSGGGGVSGCKNGYAAGGSGCTVSGSSCSITGQCGV